MRSDFSLNTRSFLEKRVKMGAGQSDMAAALVFRYTRF